MKKIAFAIVACLLAAGCGSGGSSSTFGTADSLDGLLWNMVNTITATDCGTQVVGTEQSDKTLAFTQSGNDLTAVFTVPEFAFTEGDLGGDSTVDLTGTRDGASFTLNGTATIVDFAGCVVSSPMTLTGTIGDDGTLSGSYGGTTAPNDLATCQAVLDPTLGAMGAFIYTTCTSESSYTASQP